MITNYEIKKTGELKPEKSYKTFDIGQLESTDFVKLLQMNEDPIITLIHHTDMDGICAAQIMKEYLINVLDISDTRIHYLAYNYEKDYDFNSHIAPNSKFIVFVDLSPKFKDFDNIINNDSSNSRVILWVDHHLSSVREVHDNSTKENTKLLARIDAYVDINGCGTKNVYDLTKDSNMTDIDVTYDQFSKFGSIFNEDAITLVDCYDRWLQIPLKKDADAINRLFYDSYQLFVDSELVHKLLHSYGNKKLADDTLASLIELGHKFLDLEKEKSKLKYIWLSKDLDFMTPDGRVYKASVIWGEGNSSLWGDNINDYDVVIRANYNAKDQEYYFSFYSVKEDVDCSAIAKQYLGGGHFSSAACVTSYNILNKKWKV